MVWHFCRAEAGKIELEEIEFDLRVCLEEVGEMMYMRAHSKGLELIIFVPHDLPTRLIGDSTRLKQVCFTQLRLHKHKHKRWKQFTDPSGMQVLMNLASNGVKFTEHGYVAMSVFLISSTDSHVIFRFEVSDTGIGIPQKLSAQLFEPWTQANQSTFRKYGIIFSIPIHDCPYRFPCFLNILFDLH